MKKLDNIQNELRQYLVDNFDTIFAEATKSLKYKSIVETDPTVTSEKNMKQYAFVGVGCGITYLKYRSNSKLGQAIEDAARYLRSHDIAELFLSKFTTEQQEYYNNIGCSLLAIWSQDQGMQASYYWAVAEFAKTKGLTMTVVSFLD